MATKNINRPSSGNKMIWGNLLHLGFNMWSDRKAEKDRLEAITVKPYLRFDGELWNELLRHMVGAGINMVVIDLGEGVKYESHPEIAVKGSWPVGRLKKELERMRGMGLEPIPKLNFSTTHDLWLGPYSRCVSTAAYYTVCRDLISEVCTIFGKPRFFHLGMDEETAEHQRHFAYAVMRQHELWWHDFSFLVRQVEKGGSRAWVWSDYIWHHPEAFRANMPKSVLQSNWYYGSSFSSKLVSVKAYRDLESRGFDQIPTGSNWSFPDNFEKTVAFCKKNIAPKRLLGFLQTAWMPTLPPFRKRHIEAIKQVEKARVMYYPE